MTKPRGPTGTVRGLSTPVATEILAALVERLEGELEEEDSDRTFHRSQARYILQRDWELSDSHLEGMLGALDRLPGVVALGEGRYRLPTNPVVWAKNRTWRFTIGRLNLADARVLHWLLAQQQPATLTRNLRRQSDRLAVALGSLFGPSEVEAVGHVDDNNDDTGA